MANGSVMILGAGGVVTGGRAHDRHGQLEWRQIQCPPESVRDHHHADDADDLDIFAVIETGGEQFVDPLLAESSGICNDAMDCIDL